MTILGIDYGTKRVGVALSDSSETLAFPKQVLPAKKSLAAEIQQIASSEKARLIVIGQSQNLQGEDNPLMEHIHALKKELEECGISVLLEPEFFSSMEARRFQGKVEDLDASAAALILQRFLDKQRATR